MQAYHLVDIQMCFCYFVLFPRYFSLQGNEQIAKNNIAFLVKTTKTANCQK